MSSPVLLEYLVPVFNEDARIAICINSLLNCHSSEVRVTISDNCSTDATYSICQEMAECDPRITIVKQPYNIGAIRNFEYLSDIAVGEYCHYVGSHDRVSQNYTAILLDMIKTNDYSHYFIPHYFIEWINEQGDVLNHEPMARINKGHSLYLSDDKYARYIAGIRHWPCWWYYSCIRRSALHEINLHLRDFGLLNKDTFAVSHLLVYGKPVQIPGIKYYSPAVQKPARSSDQYSARMSGASQIKYLGHYRDMLYWAISWMYHFGRILKNDPSISAVERRRYLSAAAIEIIRIYPNSLRKKIDLGSCWSS